MAHSLTSLAVFQSVIRKEMVRSLHVYESVEIEREFWFKSKSCYVEKKAKPLFRSEDFRRPEISEGNPKLEDIPNLANELKFISELKPSKIYEEEQCSSSTEGYYNSDLPKPRKLVLKQDLNCLPDSETESEESVNEKTEHSEFENDKTEQSESDAKTEILKKKKRTPSRHVAELSLEELSKYFDLTIVEASRNLKVGLTVLKKKCREFGIPRWPHRKIKSLDCLIHDLQREAEKQQEKNEAAAMAVAKKQEKLETEKRNIVKRPFMEIGIETKKFRQENFKKRHRASRAKKNQESLVTSSST